MELMLRNADDEGDNEMGTVGEGGIFDQLMLARVRPTIESGWQWEERVVCLRIFLWIHKEEEDAGGRNW